MYFLATQVSNTSHREVIGPLLPASGVVRVAGREAPALGVTLGVADQLADTSHVTRRNTDDRRLCDSSQGPAAWVRRASSWIALTTRVLARCWSGWRRARRRRHAGA